MWTRSIALMTVAIVLLAGIRADESSDDFPALLDRLEKAKTRSERGSDQMPHDPKNPGQRVVQMLGSPQTWDADGTPALREEVLARWRKRWRAEGKAMLRGLH